MASTAHMSVSVSMTTSSSEECGPTSRSAASAARMPIASPGHIWPWKRTMSSTVSGGTLVPAPLLPSTIGCSSRYYSKGILPLSCMCRTYAPYAIALTKLRARCGLLSETTG